MCQISCITDKNMPFIFHIMSKNLPDRSLARPSRGPVIERMSSLKMANDIHKHMYRHIRQAKSLRLDAIPKQRHIFATSNYSLPTQSRHRREPS